MIYDLKNLRELGCSQIDVLLAIAERLEALVEVQKPRSVEFACVDGQSLAVSPKGVSQIRSVPDAVEITSRNGQIYFVNGTYSEVLAKLRGDK